MMWFADYTRFVEPRTNSFFAMHQNSTKEELIVKNFHLIKTCTTM
jgi:hypothetical protein